MKLYARTPAGTPLGINIRLTGEVHEKNGAILLVEVMLPVGCEHVVGYTNNWSTTPDGRKLWANPTDVCADDGCPLTEEQLREEMQRGPLSENWP